MIYKVTAEFIPDRMKEFYERLTDGTIFNQKPDGQEIVASMKRAKITRPVIIEWYETCYCPTPLSHERATIYDHFLTDIRTEEAGEYGVVSGESFWEILQKIK